MQDNSRDRARPVAVFGGPGAGALAAFTLRRIAGRNGPVRFVGFLNDLVERGGKIAGETVLASFDDWPSLPTETHFLAPLHKPKQMAVRAARIAGLAVPAERWVSVVDPDAAMADGVEHGPGLFVAAHATVMPGVRLEGRSYDLGGTTGVPDLKTTNLFPSLHVERPLADWLTASANGDWVSMAVASDGSYGVPEGLISSFPVTTKDGDWEIVQGLEIDDFSRGKIDASVAELEDERSAVQDLGLI